jgi:hypothetical protein
VLDDSTWVFEQWLVGEDSLGAEPREVEGGAPIENLFGEMTTHSMAMLKSMT